VIWEAKIVASGSITDIKLICYASINYCIPEIDF